MMEFGLIIFEEKKVYRPKVFSRKYRHPISDVLMVIVFFISALVIFNPLVDTGYMNLMPIYSIFMLFFPEPSFTDYHSSGPARGFQRFLSARPTYFLVLVATIVMTSINHLLYEDTFLYAITAVLIYLKFNLTSYHAHNISFEYLDRAYPEHPAITAVTRRESDERRDFYFALIFLLVLNIVDYFISALIFQWAPLHMHDPVGILLVTTVENLLLVSTDFVFEFRVLDKYYIP